MNVKQIAVAGWPFGDPPESPAVTTIHVTTGRMPILQVSHDPDEDGESTWSFHCRTIPFSMADAQLVRLDTVVSIDPSVCEVAGLDVGCSATREAIGGKWAIHRED